MAAVVACAGKPPLLPTPPPSTRLPERKIGSDAKPGRASSSRNWSTDKLLARVSSILAGRASLSADWKKDKSDVEELMSRERRMDRKRSPSRAPSPDRSDKKAKLYYAGPAFTVQSPDPSQLPIPKFVIKSPHPSDLPMPSFRFLKTPVASSSD